MTYPTVDNPDGFGVNSVAMNEDIAKMSPAYAEPYPTTGALAWSKEDVQIELPPSRHRRMPWAIAIAAVVAAASAGWFGFDLLHEPTPAPAPIAPPAVTPAPSVKPPATPHPAPQYLWIAVAIWDHIEQNGGRSISVGYGSKQDLAIQGAQMLCHKSGHDNCLNEASAADACIGMAVGDDGSYASAIGATSDDAITMAKMHLPSAVDTRAFCAWDGNDRPPMTPTTVETPPTVATLRPPNDDDRFLAAMNRILNGAPMPDPQLAITSARTICIHLREGTTTPRQAVEDTMNANPGVPFEMASLTVETAIEIYCPQFS